MNPSPRVRASSIVIAGLLALALAPPASASAGREPSGLIRHRDGIHGSYIVVLRSAAASAGSLAVSANAASDLTREYGGTVTRLYGSALVGYAAAHMTAEQADALSRDRRVAFVEQDVRMHTDATQSPATWGLDRIDQHALPLDNAYTYGGNGSGVTAYIIDTGIDFTHQEFGGRATSGFDAVDGGSADDCNGHGTHVAGTVGGSTYGVAKGVSLVAVRVLNCRGIGSTSAIVAGIDWATSDHGAGEPAVANMSLGGGVTTSLDLAVANSIADGITYAIAAGNGNLLGQPQNACNTSPARVPTAITVSATDDTDTKASWANTGTCVDLFAPGVDITSSWNTSNSATNTISGTSMATPHVTGVAADYLSGHPTATPAQVSSVIVNGATTGVVKSPGSGSPNRLLYSVLDGVAPPSATMSLTAVKQGSSAVILNWAGATTSTVSITRNGGLPTPTANDGIYTDQLGFVRGTFTYKVCEFGTSVCSNTASVTF